MVIGYCDEEGECNCSEIELDISETLKKALNGRKISEYVRDKIKEFKDEVSSWEISESIKELVPSRCNIGDRYKKISK